MLEYICSHYATLNNYDKNLTTNENLNTIIYFNKFYVDLLKSPL